MEFGHSARVEELQGRLLAFMDEHVYPNETVYQEQLNGAASRWSQPPVMEELKAKAREAGLDNAALAHPRTPSMSFFRATS